MALFGDRLHILVESAEEAQPRIEAVLRAAGIAAHELRVIEPTLEDVFTSAIPAGGA